MNCGILIIGSLLWDPEKGRPAWRDERLDMSKAQTITAPIRYGRLSESRGDSYTMVFSRLCPVGQAKLIPCSHTVLTVNDLVAEAEYLWKAEQPSAKAHRIAAKWGCVALLRNPTREISGHLLKGWEEVVSREPDYGQVSQTKEEGVLVGPDGLLRLEWPRLVDGGAPVDFDLLLVTANDPKISASSPEYPSAEAVAAAWNNAGEQVEYFWKNRDSGITTFQDDEICKFLGPRKKSESDE